MMIWVTRLWIKALSTGEQDIVCAEQIENTREMPIWREENYSSMALYERLQSLDPGLWVLIECNGQSAQNFVTIILKCCNKKGFIWGLDWVLFLPNSVKLAERTLTWRDLHFLSQSMRQTSTFLYYETTTFKLDLFPSSDKKVRKSTFLSKKYPLWLSPLGYRNKLPFSFKWCFAFKLKTGHRGGCIVQVTLVMFVCHILVSLGLITEVSGSWGLIVDRPVTSWRMHKHLKKEIHAFYYWHLVTHKFGQSKF